MHASKRLAQVPDIKNSIAFSYKMWYSVWFVQAHKVYLHKSYCVEIDTGGRRSSVEFLCDISGPWQIIVVNLRFFCTFYRTITDNTSAELTMGQWMEV
jgi:hypothetical protein